MRYVTSRLAASCIALSVCLGTGTPVFAASGTLVANVNRVLTTTDGNWGGCMAFLSVNAGSVLPACNSWVTFSCTGEFADPLQAYRMVDQAQLALVTGKKVQLWIRDDRMHNGYCLADRIDTIR